MPGFGQFLALLAAAGAGTALPLQAGANGYLGRLLGHPLSATLVSLVVSLVTLAPLMMLMHVPFPSPVELAKGPLWSWAGGLLGVVYLTVSLVAAPKLGAATFVAVTVTGQMAVSIVLDHFGLMGFPERPVTMWRIIGLLLVVAGVAVIQLAVESQSGPP